MENRNRLIVFLKRFLLIFILFVSTVLIVYGCSAVKALNKYNYNVQSDIQSIYKSEDNLYSLTIVSKEEASFSEEDNISTYTLTIKDNVLFLDGQESRNVFIALSAKEMLWQTKNIYLFKQTQEFIYEE